MNKLEQSCCPQEGGVGGSYKTGLPCLWKGQQIPALSRWDLSHIVKKTVSPWHMSEAAGKINVASLLWPHCLFTHRDFLASFSICQHLLTTPEQGHRVADAPRRRRHLVTQQQLCSSFWGGSRLLHPFARGCNPAHCSASSIHRQAATFGNLPCPCTPQTAPLVQDTKMERTKWSGHMQEVIEDMPALQNRSRDGYRIVCLF